MNQNILDYVSLCTPGEISALGNFVQPSSVEISAHHIQMEDAGRARRKRILTPNEAVKRAGNRTSPKQVAHRMQIATPSPTSMQSSENCRSDTVLLRKQGPREKTTSGHEEWAKYRKTSASKVSAKKYDDYSAAGKAAKNEGCYMRRRGC
jgi:hypothetical protein